ncbi:MAG: type II secretion system F family protein [Pirellulaceae bacterium]|nr:type II secretion system F family protein [Pirellulaceae bacterium]
MARIRMKALRNQCERLGNSLAAGVDVVKAWEMESENRQLNSGATKKVLDRLKRGQSMAQSMSSADGYYPELVCALVDAGEQTGKVEEIFRRLSQYYDHFLKLRRNLVIAIAWPVAELVIAICVVGLVIFAIGYIADMNNTEATDLLGLGLVGTRGVVIYFGTVFAIAFFIATFVMAIVTDRIPKKVIASLLIRLPIIGVLWRNFSIERISWTLSHALNAGMDVKRAIRLSVECSQNNYYQQKIDSMKKAVQQGNTLSDVFAETGRYPEDFLMALRNGETTGTVPETMDGISTEYQGKLRTSLLIAAASLSVFTWGVVAFFIIYFIFVLAFSYVGMIYDAMPQ